MGVLADYLAQQQQAAPTAPPSSVPPPNYAPRGAVPDDRSGTGLFGFVGNIGADVGDLLGGLTQFFGTGISEALTQPTNVLKEFATLGFADTPVNVLTPAVLPHMAQSIAADVKDRYFDGDIGAEMYDHPLSFAMDILSVAGGAGAIARAATGTGAVAGRLGEALLGTERVAENAKLLSTYRAARIAGEAVPAAAEAGASVGLAAATDELLQASRGTSVLNAGRSGLESVGQLVQKWGALPNDTRKAMILDALVPEPLKVAEASSGFTFDIAPTRNPLVRAVWSDPIRRKYLTDAIAPMRDEYRVLKSLDETGMLTPGESQRMGQLGSALSRMDAEGAQLVAKPTYGGTLLAKRKMTGAVDKMLGQLNLRGYQDRRNGQQAMNVIIRNLQDANVPPEHVERFSDLLEGMDDGQIVGMPRDVLEAQLRAKGYDSVEAAMRDHLHGTGNHEALSIDERNAMDRMILDGHVASQELWRYAPDASLTALPERMRYEGRFRTAANEVGIGPQQQDLLMSMYDSAAQAIARHNPERFPTPDAVFAKMDAEFADTWAGTVGSVDAESQRLRAAVQGLVGPELGADELFTGDVGPLMGVFSTDRAFSSLMPGRGLEPYVSEVRGRLNSLLGPDEVPYSMSEAQAIVWKRTNDAVGEAIGIMRRRIGTSDLPPAEVAKARKYLDRVESSIASGRDIEATWKALEQTTYGKELLGKVQEFLGDPLNVAAKISNEVKGSATFGPDFDVLMRFFRTGDFTTFVHEYGHTLRRFLPQELSDLLWDHYRYRVHGETGPTAAGPELLQTGDPQPGDWKQVYDKTEFADPVARQLFERAQAGGSAAPKSASGRFGKAETVSENDAYYLIRVVKNTDPETGKAIDYEWYAMPKDPAHVAEGATEPVLGYSLGTAKGRPDIRYRGDVADQGRWRKFGVAGVEGKLETVLNPTYRGGAERFAAVTRPDGVQLSEGQIVRMADGELGYVQNVGVSVSKGKQRYSAGVIPLRRGEGVRNLPIEDVTPFDAMDPKALGLENPRGVDHGTPNTIASRFDTYRGVSVGERVQIGGKDYRVQEFALAPSIEWRNGELVNLEPRISVVAKRVKERTVKDYRGGPDTTVWDDYGSAERFPVDEMGGAAAAPEAPVAPEAVAPPAETFEQVRARQIAEAPAALEPIVPKSQPLDRNVHVWVQGAPGSRSFKDMREAEKAVSQLQATASKEAAIVVESRGNINAVHRFTMGDDGFQAWHRYDDATVPASVGPAFSQQITDAEMTKIDDVMGAHFAAGREVPARDVPSGTIMTKAGIGPYGELTTFAVPADTPVGTRVMFGGDVSPEPLVGLVKEIDPNDPSLVFGNDVMTEKLVGAENKAATELPLAMRDEQGRLVLLEGNHRRYLAQQRGEPVMRYVEVDPNNPAPMRDVQAEQVARGGLSDTAEAAAQDDFAARLAAATERKAPVAPATTASGTVRKKDVKLGQTYTKTVSGKRVRVRIDRENPRGGWDGTNLDTGRKIRVRSAQGLAPDATVREMTSAVPPAQDVRYERAQREELARSEAARAKYHEERLAGAAAPAATGPEGVPPDLPPGEPPTGPVGAPPRGPEDKPWSRQMEEAFAQDLERWFYGKAEELSVDPTILPAYRILSEFVMDTWRKMRSFFSERQLVPYEAGKVFDEFLGGTFSPFTEGPRLDPGRRRRIRVIPQAGDLTARYGPADAVEQVPITAEMGGAQELRARAIRAQEPLITKLAATFGPKAVRTDLKGLGAIARKMADNVKALDASRARVIIDSWDKADEAVSKIEQSGLQIVGVDDHRRLPGEAGRRGLTALVVDPEAPDIVSEIEIATPMFDRFRNATYAHDSLLSDTNVDVAKTEDTLARLQTATEPDATEISRVATDLDALRVKQEAGRRYMEGLYEMVADEIDASYGTPIPGAAMRQAMNETRLWVAQHLETDLIHNGYFDFQDILERAYLPQRIRSGASWRVDHGEDGGFYGGKGTFTLDDERAAAGLPQPVYYPHIEGQNPGDFILQRSGQGQRKLAANKNLRRTRGTLFTTDAYIKDPGSAYAIRAARAIKMRDTYEMIAKITQGFGHRIASPDDLLPGESLIAPDFTMKFFNAVIGIEDRMGALLSKMDKTELVGAVQELSAKLGREMAPDIVAAGIRQALNVDEMEAGALARSVTEAIDATNRSLLGVTKKGIDLYAVPKVVAERLHESVRYQMGPGVRVMWDKPTQLWKSIVLYGRPAWVLNNMLSNTGFAAIGGVKVREILRAVLDRPYRDKLDQLAKDAGMADEVATSFGRSTDLLPTNLGIAQERLLGRLESSLEAKARGSRALHPFKVYADWIRKMNGEVESAYRRVAFAEGIRKARTETLGSMLSETNQVGQKFWRTKDGLEQMMIDGISPAEARRAMDLTNEWFGDYTNLSPVARNVVRRFIFPFWSFYRHVGRLLIKLPGEYPGKTAFMRSMALLANDLRSQQGAFPSWMANMIPFGPIGSDGKEPFISLAGPNPFNVFQDTSLALLHPMLKVALEQITGRDAYTQREFTDPDVFQPFGSDQRYRIVRGPGGVPVDAVPVEKVVPGLGVSVLSQVPQYDWTRSLVAGGRPYDTQGILGSAAEGPMTNGAGQPVSPFGLEDAALRLLVGTSPTSYDVTGYRERLAKEREDALMQAYERWAESQVGSPQGVG